MGGRQSVQGRHDWTVEGFELVNKTGGKDRTLEPGYVFPVVLQCRSHLRHGYVGPAEPLTVPMFKLG